MYMGYGDRKYAYFCGVKDQKHLGRGSGRQHAAENPLELGSNFHPEGIVGGECIEQSATLRQQENESILQAFISPIRVILETNAFKAIDHQLVDPILLTGWHRQGLVELHSMLDECVDDVLLPSAASMMMLEIVIDILEDVGVLVLNAGLLEVG